MKEEDMHDPASWHDPELPFLGVLEQEVRRQAERAAMLHEQRQRLGGSGTLGARPPLREHVPQAAEQRSPSRIRATSARLGGGSATRRTADLQRTSARIARRSLTLVLLLSLIGASAYGASRAFSGEGNPLAPQRGAYVVVATGSSGSASWRLRLYVRGDELCRELSSDESETSECASPPATRRLEASSAQSASGRYVFGVTGSLVKRVRVSIGGRRQTVSTYTPGLRQRRSAGLPAHVRFFLASFSRTSGAGAPAARVQGLDPRGRALGAPVPSCLETSEARC